MRWKQGAAGASVAQRVLATINWFRVSSESGIWTALVL
jgi:hypothetical protein